MPEMIQGYCARHNSFRRKATKWCGKKKKHQKRALMLNYPPFLPQVGEFVKREPGAPRDFSDFLIKKRLLHRYLYNRRNAGQSQALHYALLYFQDSGVFRVR